MNLNWTWPKAIVASVGLLCGAGVIVLGRGDALVAVLAAVGTASGGVALFLQSLIREDRKDVKDAKDGDA